MNVNGKIMNTNSLITSSIFPAEVAKNLALRDNRSGNKKGENDVSSPFFQGFFLSKVGGFLAPEFCGATPEMVLFATNAFFGKPEIEFHPY